MNFKFEIKPVEINPTPFMKAAATASQTNESGEKLACKTRLADYKIKTVNGQRLKGDELGNACRLVRKMNRRGWLTEEDKKWCSDNRIAL